MGTGTSLTLGRDMARKKGQQGVVARRSAGLGIDVPLLLIVITLLIFGLMMVLRQHRLFRGNPARGAHLYVQPPGGLDVSRRIRDGIVCVD